MNFVLNDNQSVNFIKEDAYEYEGVQRRIKQSRANANITALTQCALPRGENIRFHFYVRLFPISKCTMFPEWEM